MAAQLPHGPATNDSYRRYLQLSTQQESLRHHLTVQIPPSTPSLSHEPSYSPTPSSPTSHRSSFSDPHSPTASPHSSMSLSNTTMSPIPAVPGTAHAAPAATQDSQLYDVNKQVKAVLTELLNTDGVRSDEKFRSWVQGRLMETEMEMRRQRRRRSSVDREVLESIAEHFEHDTSYA
ncbi:uncharacterized protein K452DRAFT_304139 [Aplosporella prunicola CBS 121167]|uniref:Uncharacterized protein n=1 Tax=Aplosporella prunicola CBS 121167 TaxID=1176127 RepID=A0A6A6BX24_9PEZI|nr:uncharacterized protein K452DRAFT_304139 [Aplosporella prunicola CBS 121167]KAF2147271.1 hypothetical protein K452DRAFT_304139 [Aplosporella prunicola CBS 121167]